MPTINGFMRLLPRSGRSPGDCAGDRSDAQFLSRGSSPRLARAFQYLSGSDRRCVGDAHPLASADALEAGGVDADPGGALSGVIRRVDGVGVHTVDGHDVLVRLCLLYTSDAADDLTRVDL